MKKPVFRVFSLFLLLTLAGCLALEGLASPTVAKTIVVTTLDDIANPPFDAGGPGGTGTSATCPGMASSRCAKPSLPLTTPLTRTPSPLLPA